jgi:hydrogenase maturation protease
MSYGGIELATDESAMKILIVAYGNPLRGDDAVAWYVAEHLADLGNCPHVTLITCQALTPELAAAVTGSVLTLFIDADAGPMPGAVACSAVHAESWSRRSMMHNLTPGQMLGLAHSVYQSGPDQALLYTVTGQCFDHGEGLSIAVADAAQRLAKHLRTFINARVNELSLSDSLVRMQAHEVVAVINDLLAFEVNALL